MRRCIPCAVFYCVKFICSDNTGLPIEFNDPNYLSEIENTLRVIERNITDVCYFVVEIDHLRRLEDANVGLIVGVGLEAPVVSYIDFIVQIVSRK